MSDQTDDRVIVLEMHGAPPNDFPRAEMGEFHALHARLEQGAPSMSGAMKARVEMLDRLLRASVPPTR